MSLLMSDSHPLIIDKKLAELIGLNQAMVLQQVHYWLEKNKQSNINFHEGRYWTYNTIKDWQEEFPFWSKETVKRIFKELRDSEFLLVDNFNTMKMDRTLWYSVDYDKLKEYIRSNSPSDQIENDPMQEVNMTQAIPETTTEITTDIYNQSVNQGAKEYKQDKEVKKDKEAKQVKQVKESKKTKDHKYKTDRKTDRLKYEYKSMIKRCELFAIDENYREAVGHAIELLLLDTRDKKRLRIGDNCYPIEMVKRDLKKIDFHIVQHAVNKFKEASTSYEIKNTIYYLKACIYNAIYEIDIEIDSRLRTSGII